MLLQLVVSLVPLVNLQHHRVKLSVQGLICGILRRYGPIDDRHGRKVGGSLARIRLAVTAWRGRLRRRHRSLIVVILLLVGLLIVVIVVLMLLVHHRNVLEQPATTLEVHLSAVLLQMVTAARGSCPILLLLQRLVRHFSGCVILGRLGELVKHASRTCIFTAIGAANVLLVLVV